MSWEGGGEKDKPRGKGYTSEGAVYKCAIMLIIMCTHLFAKQVSCVTPWIVSEF